jgi:hypothetical protein
MKQTFNTEWIVRLPEAGASNADAVVVYRTESTVDAHGEPSGVKRLWVAARGYEGEGIVGAFSGVASFDENSKIESIASCQQAFPEGDDFESSANYEMLAENDLQVLVELWAKVDEFTAFDPDAEESFVAKVTVPEGEDFVASDGWDPDDLLEPISEEWQLMLKF